MLDSSLHGYVLKRLIAAGGMAAVFEGEHEVSHSRVAVKVLSRDLRRHREPLSRILQEGRVICSLLHEHIVRVLDYGTADENVAFVVMELLAGQTLRETLDNEGILDPARVVFIGRQICAGLQAAHARDVYHRDIKPENIMLVDGQRHGDFVKIVDFGIARLEAGDPAKLAATATGTTLGTPQYMSPEQAQATRIDARSDIYQTGLVLYELLVGEPPFWHNNPVRVMTMHVERAPPPIRARRPDVPLELELIIMRCLEKQPEDRFESAEALLNALDKLAERDTAGHQVVEVVIPGAQPTEAPINLRMPTLGSPADLERYARNLSVVLAQLWPDEVPPDLRIMQGALWSLTEDRDNTGERLAMARAEVDEIVRSLESRLQPLERAIEALNRDRERLEGELSTLRARIAEMEGITRSLDADYARIYKEIEQNQSTLYSSNTSSSRPVDFRDLYREDIASRLNKLQRIYQQRSEQAEQIHVLRADEASFVPRLADIRLQLAELGKSRLSIEAERAGRLSASEVSVAGLANRHQALERAVEHQYLQLGLAFRQAVSELLKQRA